MNAQVLQFDMQARENIAGLQVGSDNLPDNNQAVSILPSKSQQKDHIVNVSNYFGLTHCNQVQSGACRECSIKEWLHYMVLNILN